MTARCPMASAVSLRNSSASIGHQMPRQRPIEHSLYFGRQRLGRYVQTDRKRFTAFDTLDRPLGNFRSRARALTAIRNAWARLA
jgi:hypothetical protein